VGQALTSHQKPLCLSIESSSVFRWCRQAVTNSSCREHLVHNGVGLASFQLTLLRGLPPFHLGNRYFISRLRESCTLIWIRCLRVLPKDCISFFTQHAIFKSSLLRYFQLLLAPQAWTHRAEKRLPAKIYVNILGSAFQSHCHSFFVFFRVISVSSHPSSS